MYQNEVWLGIVGSYFIPALGAVIGIGWYTTVERKLLAGIMVRKGPNVVGYWGVLQPLADGINLFTNELVMPTYSNKLIFLLCPIFSFFVAILAWLIYPFNAAEGVFGCSVFYFLVVSSLNMYGVVGAGWSSNSNYALLGAVRGIAQAISYEVVMGLLVLVCVFLAGTLDIQEIKDWYTDSLSAPAVIFSLLFFVWLVCILAESNRAPFDFVEGESELVSGYNVEYSAGAFALLYMAEYSGMLFNSIITAAIWMGGCDSLVSVITMVFVYFYVWVRATLPRYRYDLFMMFMWRSVLPCVIVGLWFVMIFVFCSNVAV